MNGDGTQRSCERSVGCVLPRNHGGRCRVGEAVRVGRANAQDEDVIDWWSSLNHGGLLIAPPRIPEFFSGALDRLPAYRVERLRRDVTRVQADADKAMGPFLDTVFEDLLALPTSQWMKASAVDKRFSHASVTGEIVKPQRV